jgi:hypothetical protein
VLTTQTTAAERAARQNPYASSGSTATQRGIVSHAQKFDIYADSAPLHSTAAPLKSRTRSVPEEGAFAAVPAHRAAPRTSGSDFEIDRMNTNFEQVQITNALSSVAPAAAVVPRQQAWSWNDEKDVFPASRSVAPPAEHVSTPAPTVRAAPEPALAPAVESEAMCISTPQDQVINAKEPRPLGTLEAMHDMLNHSFSVVDAPAAGANRQRWSQEGLPRTSSGAGAGPVASVASSSTPSGPVAKVWVVRYVDYTSKYGLGFLFNTGSAGVYFNDSTKIVLSADGTVFQYTERRRRDSSTVSEHASQKHLITSYPPELQKKVTLLKHFRNYLLDQERSHGNGRGGADGDAGRGMSGNPDLIRDGVVSDGANASVKFGQSSTRYRSELENAASSTLMPMSPLGSGAMLEDEEDQDMPFLKKWVRTKHAILFRISNRTVQVVFYDRR